MGSQRVVKVSAAGRNDRRVVSIYKSGSYLSLTNGQGAGAHRMRVNKTLDYVNGLRLELLVVNENGCFQGKQQNTANV